MEKGPPNPGRSGTMEESQDQLLEALPQAVFFLDAHLAVSYANPAFQKLLGRNRDACFGLFLGDLFASGTTDSVGERLKELADGTVFDAVFEASPKDAGERRIRVTVRRVPSAAECPARTFVGGVEDVTLLRKMEEKQASLLKAAETASSELKEFVSIVSHDLKAPLRGISSLAGWIRDDFAERIGEDGRENLDLLISRVHRMYAMIEGLLRFSRIANSSEAAGPVDLEAVLEDTIRALSPKEGVRVLRETPLPVVGGTRGRLRELFQSLLDNALKSMDKEGGEIRIGACREQERWKIWIKDDGKGIPLEHQERIFKLFQKVSPDEEGIGIGLTLAKKIVQLEGGELSLQSKPREGTLLSFTLPTPEALPDYLHSRRSSE